MSFTMAENKNKVQTLVFMDLETTGLASLVGKKNVHITEMSFVAVDRQSFEHDRNLRVINKLSLCVRPRSLVSPGAMSITGLYNDNLEQQKEFDKSVPQLLEFFFRRLQAPICLLAHNGAKFDFPVLQAELKRLNYALDPQVLCADTIQAFRWIFLPTNFPAPVQQNTLVEGEPDKDEIDLLLSQNMESFSCMKPLPSVHCSQLSPKGDDVSPPKDKEEGDFLDPAQNNKTPLNTKQTAHCMQVRKKRKASKEMEASSVKRALFPKPPPKMSLESLYIYCFGESPPQSHYAEIDCITLSKVSQQMSPNFLKWIDANCKAFCSTDALW